MRSIKARFGFWSEKTKSRETETSFLIERHDYIVVLLGSGWEFQNMHGIGVAEDMKWGSVPVLIRASAQTIPNIRENSRDSPRTIVVVVGDPSHGLKLYWFGDFFSGCIVLGISEIHTNSDDIGKIHRNPSQVAHKAETPEF